MFFFEDTLFNNAAHIGDMIRQKRVELAEKIEIVPHYLAKSNLRSGVWKYFGMAYHLHPTLPKRCFGADYRWCIKCLEQYKAGTSSEITR